MVMVTVQKAMRNLSRLIRRAEAGEDVIIARGSVPAVRLIAVREHKRVRKFGALAGEVSVTNAFFDPLPDAELL